MLCCTGHFQSVVQAYEFALQVAMSVITYYEQFFDTTYPLHKQRMYACVSMYLLGCIGWLFENQKCFVAHYSNRAVTAFIIR